LFQIQLLFLPLSNSASAECVSAGLYFFRGGAPEILAGSRVGGDESDFFFSYRTPFKGTFSPADEARLEYLLTNQDNPDEPNAADEITLLAATYDLRVQLVRGQRTVATLRNKYPGFTVSVDRVTGDRKVADISPLTGSVGEINGRVSRIDSAICTRESTGKRVIPAARRGDIISLIIGNKVSPTVLATSQFKKCRSSAKLT